MFLVCLIKKLKFSQVTDRAAGVVTWRFGKAEQCWVNIPVPAATIHYRESHFSFSDVVYVLCRDHRNTRNLAQSYSLEGVLSHRYHS